MNDHLDYVVLVTFLCVGVWRIESDSVIQSMISSAASA